MARTAEQIIQQLLGQMIFQYAIAQAALEATQERPAADPKKMKKPPVTAVGGE